MGLEIERKFLISSQAWQEEAGEGLHIMQGYLNRTPGRTVRVRVKGDKGYITIKGESVKASRAEYEYEIPYQDAKEMLERLCEKPIIDKHRYLIQQEEVVWEIDVFHGDNEGLVLAEVELSNEDQQVYLPAWIAKEVTEDKRFYNSNLITNPYKLWKREVENPK